MKDYKDFAICNGFICQYTCKDQFADMAASFNNTEFNLFEINYKYQIYQTNSTFDEHALAEIESNILRATSIQLHLDNCFFDRQRQFRFGSNYNWIYNNVTIDANDIIIAILASTPFDELEQSADEGKIYDHYTLSNV